MGIFDLFSDDNEKAAARAQKRGLQQGRNEAYRYIDEGQAGFDEFASRAYDEFGTYDDIGRAGATRYADALGLNGADAASAARDAFTSSAGYDFVRDEALRGVERAGSKYGWNNSGNLAAALEDRAAGLASTESNNWLDRLSGVMDDGIQVAGARSGILTGQGAQRYNTGLTKGQIGWNAETGMGQAEAEFQKSKDQSGLNIFDAVMGTLKLAAGA